MIEFINIQNFKTLLNASFPLGNLNLFSQALMAWENQRLCKVYCF